VGHVAFVLSGAAMQMYETGEIDVTDVSIWDLERVMDEENPLHQQLMMFPELSLTYFGFNTQKPPFDNPKVRQALCLAVDRPRVVSQVLKDSVSAAYGILPPGMPGYNTELQGLDYDLDRARELLTECGYGDDVNLPTIIFNVPGAGGYVAASLTAVLYQWAQNFADFGLEIEIRQLDSDAYFYRLDEEKDDIFFYGWVADYADPQNFLEILFRTDSANNVGHYSNSQVDALLEQAATEQDTDKRFDLYQQVEQIMVSDAACLPLWFGQNYILVKPHVEGYTLSPLGIPLLAKVSVNK
jgi:oligopeptide transport system substrate-binding protein